MTRPLQLPPLKTLLKSTEVEDPINIRVHRPLAYGFVRLIWRTPITPNMVTLMSVIVGTIAGAMFIWGSRGAMVAGGILLWSAAILDGADGLLARAKKLQSEFGRAIDGWADMVVALVTVLPAIYHLWTQQHDTTYLWIAVPAILMTSVHLSLYDYFKESYLRMTRPDGRGEGQDYDQTAQQIEVARENGLLSYVAVKHVMLPYLKQQQRLIRFFDPDSRELRQLMTKPEFAATYRKHNLIPMRLLTMTSLAPHSYLMAWCAMADRVDVYLWIRLVPMNIIFIIALIWQRWATQRMIKELDGNYEYSRDLVHCKQDL
ncbi:MAG: phosphatidylglycerophosphate synthase [Polyangiales bacterium]|jgi:phosphatidylglycerophosphate synthase